MLVYICDDDNVQLEELKKCLEKYCLENGRDMDIKAYCSVENMLVDMASEKGHIDIFFLDVELGKYNGIEIAERIRINNKLSEIIFISSYEQYVHDAFRTSPADYIVKPIDVHELDRTLDWVCEKKDNNRTVKIISERKELNIPVDEIVYIEGNGRKVNVCLNDKQYVVYEKLDDIEKKIKEVSQLYIRIHKSYLVNYKYIKNIKSDKITLSDGSELSVSRKYKEEVKQFRIKIFGLRDK